MQIHCSCVVLLYAAAHLDSCEHMSECSMCREVCALAFSCVSCMVIQTLTRNLCFTNEK